MKKYVVLTISNNIKLQSIREYYNICKRKQKMLIEGHLQNSRNVGYIQNKCACIT